MAEEINGNGTPVVTPAVAPEVPTTERLTVPASALFSDTERTLDTPAVKPVETPAADPVTEIPAVKPVETPAADPAAETPAVKPAETPAAVPAKIKIGNKEYTQAELEQAMVDRAKPVAAPAQAPAAAPAPKAPTPEEISQAESNWCSKFAQDSKLNFAPTPEEVETILSGGEEASKLLATKFNDICAKAVLLARKSIYAEMNPVLSSVNDRLSPVVANAQEVERAAAEQMFFSAYPDLKVDTDTMQQARSVADALLARYPDEVRAMTPEQFMAEVHRQTDVILQQDYKRWNPAATGSWRDAKKPATPAAAPAVPAAVPAAKPAAPKAPVIQAPGANSPAAIPAPGGNPNWQKETAKSLAD